MIQYAAKGLEPDLALSDVLVPVHARAERSFRIVHVHDSDAIEPYRAVNSQERGFKPIGRAKIPTSREGVRGINADAERKVGTSVEYAPQFFKA